MKKTFFLIFILIAFVGYIYFSEAPEVEEREWELGDPQLEYVGEGIETEGVKVLDDGEVVYQITINEIRDWTSQNWDIFDEIPEVGGREVDPEYFGFIDRSASISPNGRKLAFSVHDYAVATTTSFIIIADLKDESLEMVREPVRGSIDHFVWSGDSNKVAYILGTARAGGDFLAVDDILNLERLVLLSEKDILDVLDPDGVLVEVGQFMPQFRSVDFYESSLYFQSDHPKGPPVDWSFNFDESELIIVE